MVFLFVKRPPSPLDFDPIETPPQDILYPGSEQEDGYDDEKRAKKKLRVETLGKQYLAGRGLFIQSASLKGPFEKGWVNPWMSRKRKRNEDNHKRCTETPLAAADRRSGSRAAEKDYATVKKRPATGSKLDVPNNDSARELSPDTTSSRHREHLAKRQRHYTPQQTDSNTVQRSSQANSTVQTSVRKGWLKSDKVYLQHGARDNRTSPTPTPAAKNPIREPATPPRLPGPQSGNSNPSSTSSFQRSDTQPSKIASIIGRSASKDKSSLADPTPEKPKTAIGRVLDQRRVAALERSNTSIKELGLFELGRKTKQGYEDVRRLSQEALRRENAEAGWAQMGNVSQAAVPRRHRNSERNNVPQPIAVGDACSTAALRPAPTVAKPSSYTLAPSTYQSEFQYRYSRKGFSPGPTRQGASVDKPPQQIQTGARSISGSFPGSNAFDEDVEAAQAKVVSGSMASCHTSTPTRENHETTNFKKNTEAITRLTFSPSGRAKVTVSRMSSEPEANTPSHRRDQSKKGAHKDGALVPKTPTQSSGLPTTTGPSLSDNQPVLQEAQNAADALLQLSQGRSHPSTNLLETDKQSPKLPSFESDSYLDLSTQAAFLKAQRSFKDDVLSSLKRAPTYGRDEPPIASRANGPYATPVANGGPNNAAAKLPLPSADPYDTEDEEPMSTQAMVEAMSPFAITTVKKPQAKHNGANDERQRRSIKRIQDRLGCSLDRIFAKWNPADNTVFPHRTVVEIERIIREYPDETGETIRGMLNEGLNGQMENFDQTLFSRRLSSRVIADNNQASTPQHSSQQSPAPMPMPTPTPAPIMSPGWPTTPPFNRTSLSMSTTPSQSRKPPEPSPPIPRTQPTTTSKQPSSSSSFSILPNGTLTQWSAQQEGQRVWYNSLPPNHFGLSSTAPNGSASGNGDKLPSTLDLNDAINHAAIFLGDWDVEAEARKQGALSNKPTTNSAKGILSAGNGRV